MSKSFRRLIFAILVLFSCTFINLYAEEGYIGTYKFTNNLTENVVLTFTAQSVSDTVIYDASGNVTDYLLGESIRANKHITLNPGYSCLIGNLSDNISMSQEILAEKSDVSSVITQYTFTPENSYLLKNTLDKKLFLKAKDSAYAKLIHYNGDDNITDYEYSSGFATWGRDIEKNYSMWIEGLDATLYYPTEFAFEITNHKTETRFTEYTFLPENSYLLKNTLDKKLSMKAKASAYAKLIHYNGDDNITNYEYSGSFATWGKDIEKNYSIWIEGLDATLYYPTEFAFEITNHEKETRFTEYTFTPENSYLLKNTLDKKLSFKAKAQAYAKLIHYNGDDNIVGYEYSGGFATYGKDIEKNYSMWIEGLDATLYYPTEFAFEITNHKTETRFTEYTFTPENSYLLKNTLDKKLSMKAKAQAYAKLIHYNGDDNITDYEYSGGFATYGRDIEKNYSIWIEGLSATLYYPTEFAFKITNHEDETRLAEYTLNSENSYLIKNTGYFNLNIKAKAYADRKFISYTPTNDVTDYNLNSYFNTYSNTINALSSLWIENCDAVLYYPTEYTIEITNHKNETRFTLQSLKAGNSYLIKNTGEINLSFKPVASINGNSIIYKSDVIDSYRLSQPVNTGGFTINKGYSAWFENINTDMDIYYPDSYSLSFSDYGTESRYHALTMDSSLGYYITNTSSVTRPFLLTESTTADIVRYNSAGDIEEYKSGTSINNSYNISADKSYMFENCGGTFYLPSALIDSGDITVKLNDKAGILTEYSLSADKVYEIKNTGSSTCSFHSEGLGTMRYISYLKDGSINRYRLMKGSKNPSFSLQSGEKYLVENADGKIYFPKEFDGLISFTEKSEPIFRTVTMPKETALKISNSSDQSRLVLVENQSYDLVTYNSDTQKNYIQNQRSDFNVYKNKYALIKNISGENLTLYIPSEIYGRFLTVAQLSSSDFDKATIEGFIAVRVLKELSIPDGEEKKFSNDYLRNYQVSVYNNTKGSSVSFTKTDSGLYLSESSAASGDSLAITLTSGHASIASVNVTLDQSRFAEAEIITVEKGKINVVCDGIQSINLGIYIYDSNQNRIHTIRNASALSSLLQSGEYTVVVFNKEGSLPTLNTIQAISDCALIENTHYVKTTALVEDGKITVCSFDSIPKVTDDDLSYMVLDKTRFTVNIQSSMNGKNLIFNLDYEIKDAIYPRLDSYSIEFNLADDLILFEDSVIINGEATEYSYQNNTVTVNPKASKGNISFYVKALRNDVFHFSPQIKFRGNNVSKTEALAAIDFSNQFVTLYTQNTSSDGTVTVTGTAKPHTRVYIYVDGERNTSVMTGVTGSYNAKINLPEPYAGREYIVHAESNGAATYSDEISLFSTSETERLISNEINVMYHPLIPKFEELWLKVYSGNDVKVYNLLSEDVHTTTLPVRFDFCYEAKIPGPVAESYVVSHDSYLKLYYNPNTDKYSTKLMPSSEFFTAEAGKIFYADPKVFFHDTHTEESFQESLPPILKKENLDFSLSEMPVSEVPPDITDAYNNELEIESYYRLNLFSTESSGYDLNLPFDAVIFKDTQETTEESPCEKKSRTVYGSNKMAISHSACLDVLIGSNRNDVSEITVVQPMLAGYLSAFYGLNTFNTTVETVSDAVPITYSEQPEISFMSVQDEDYVIETLSSSKSQGIISIGSGHYHGDTYVPVSESYMNPDPEMHQKAQDYAKEQMKGDPVGDAAKEAGEAAIISMTGEVAADAIAYKNAKEDGEGAKGVVETFLRHLIGGREDDEDEEDDGSEEGSDEDYEIPTISKTYGDYIYEKTVAFIDFLMNLDPSGYVYEGYVENRLEGVTVTAYYLEGDKNIKWIAEEFGQQNPLRTDEYGSYAWDVPDGTWTVKYEKDGYTTAYREGLVVPPPRTEVNVGLVSTEGANLSALYAEGQDIILDFTKPVFSADLIADNIVLKTDNAPIGFTVKPFSVHESEYGKLSMKAVITPTNPLISGKNYSVSVSDSVKTYNGISAKGSLSFTHKPLTLSISSGTINLNEGDSCTLNISVGGEDLSGVSYEIYGVNTAVIEVAYDGSLDENGKGTISIDALSVGSSDIKIRIKDTNIEKTVKIKVYPAGYDFEVDKGMSYNSYDKILSVSTPTNIAGCSVICGEYGAIGELLDVHIFENAVLDVGTTDFELNGLLSDKWHMLKFFVLDSVHTLMPLFNTLEY